jgi:agmatinase
MRYEGVYLKPTHGFDMKKSVLDNFDPNGQGIKGNLFGLPLSVADASLVILPVPWEATVTYHHGAAGGPTAILDASYQVDLCVKNIPDAWKLGIAMMPVKDDIREESKKLRDLVQRHVEKLERQGEIANDDPVLLKINEACEALNVYIRSTTLQWLRSGKMIGLIGGDHSTPLGFIRALADHHKTFGILQIDAHADLRKAYQGIVNSHASIMYNALRIPVVSKLVQVGIRDFCDEELTMIRRAGNRIVTFFDEDIKSEMYSGVTWDEICDRIIATLPDKVYVSFDIDGLDPKFCPGTGTPVPGGLEFHQVVHLLQKIAKSNKHIVGFDLCEVSSVPGNDWDANVGARMLYHLCNIMAVSQKRLKFVS